MRWSKYYIPTLKEAPADAEVISHQLMVRAGMIRKLAAGIYSYLPLGLKALARVETVVREEMDRAGALEVLLPAVQPADLWLESGRWTQYGKELLRFQDRNRRDACLGPTHEEVVTDLVRGELRSYRRLPLILYQIQTKFRDEIRPRFGLIRGREFIMKDAYSFDRDPAGAEKSYQAMSEAYRRVFSRLGLQYRVVEADSGAIGGKHSHEFMVLAHTGEDTIAACAACSYAANLERAEVLAPEAKDLSVPPPLREIPTPGAHTVEEVSAFLQTPARGILKTLLFFADGKPVGALLRGDRELNEIKLKRFLDADEIRLASPEEVSALTGAPPGFAGPVNLPVSRLAADLELAAGAGWITGANKADAHLIHVNLARDVPAAVYADLRSLDEGDPCPRCQGPIRLLRGIEVGHVFNLGLKYSRPMKAVFLDEAGREQPMVMGCYGIGISRILAAAIEQNHDENGILFPPPLAPFTLILANLDARSEACAAKALQLYSLLREEGLDLLLDDREERPGVKFKDLDLLGAPMQLLLGARSLARGCVEAKDRRSGARTDLPLDAFLPAFREWRSGVEAGWAG
ncbi:MAG: proline--tRNA ligase [Deltaproteobacteria bacterium]|jgi:prolyl-tRNA synthetase|nr:proline--tRNA ligase [Deltaproteobacteria bacterium]